MNKLWLLILVVLSACSVNNNYGLRLENDIVGDTDQNYTHGTFFFHSTIHEEASKPAKWVAEKLPSFKIFDSDPEDITRIRTEVGQEIHTPSDLSVEEVIEDDNPYAGYLYGKISRINASPNFKIETGLSLGIIGPSALAKEVQSFVHNDLGRGTDPRGWGNQLRDEPAINLEYIRQKFRPMGKYAGITGKSQLRVGTIYTDFTYSKGLIIGRNIPKFDATHANNLSYYWFGKSNFNLVGRNVFYDGNLWRDSHNVTTKHLVGSVDTGIGAEYKGYSMKFKVTATSRQYKEQKNYISVFGGLSFGVDW